MTVESVNAAPTKSFFVQMLTRDIELEDAILDLLDNCVDGIQRNTVAAHSSSSPYKGFWARIEFSEAYFKVEDNCGGIPIDIAERYAFRMGRPSDANNIDDNVYTIGTYGIGMKRSIFKMGRSSQIISQTDSESFKVTINSDWLGSDSDWNLPLERFEKPLDANGTIVEVGDLYEPIKKEFASEKSTLYDSLTGKIANHYSYILHKGFSVSVNGTAVVPRPLHLLWDGLEELGHKSTIAPYLYKNQLNGVDINLAIGFYRPIPTEEETDKEMRGSRMRSSEAGITIICNDRVVLYCDKTRLTGWGEMQVPNFHFQFVAISGIVHFRSRDARKLPMTTTKRGIDAASETYLYVKDFMREGIKHFTSYTNRWKTRLSEEREQASKAKAIDPQELFDKVPTELWTKVRNRTDELKFVPKLPTPAPSTHQGNVLRKTMKFSRPNGEVELVSEYLFEDANRSANDVGEECFETVLRRASR